MKLKYLVLHVQLVNLQKVVTHDGAEATLTYKRLRAELTPIDHDGGTLVLLLPVNTVGLEAGEVAEIDLPCEIAPDGPAETEVLVLDTPEGSN